MKTHIFLLLLLTSLFFNSAICAENNVAKVILLKGEVKGKLIDGTEFKVSENQDIKEGSVLQTEDKSFVKLLFIDKSQMNLGPKSQMVINSFPKGDPGIITLVKGQLRSKVTKDYMDMDDKEKSKLFIKTSSAAMGVRGTDFQVNFNELNHNTALITFQGAVAMVNISRNEPVQIDHRHLEYAVSSEKAVLVKEGQISAVNLNISELAMVPTKLGKSQITALKENETGVKQSNETPSESNTKAFRSPIPPGVDGAILSTKVDVVPTTSASGFFNQKTGEYKLPAGSIIDLNSVNIIPPPVNAVFDPNSKMYVVPTTFGKVDATTGEYKAPEGLKLGIDGKFREIPKEIKEEKKENFKEVVKEEKKDDKKEEKKDERAPASVMNPPPKPMEGPTGIFEGQPGMTQFAATFAAPVAPPIIDPNRPAPPPPPPVMNDALKAIASDRINSTETINNNNQNLGTNNPNSRVKFIFNVK